MFPVHKTPAGRRIRVKALGLEIGLELRLQLLNICLKPSTENVTLGLLSLIKSLDAQLHNSLAAEKLREMAKITLTVRYFLIAIPHMSPYV